MPGGKFTIPNQLNPSMFAATIPEILGAQLPEYEPGYTGRGYTGGLEEPWVGTPEDAIFLVAPYLKLLGKAGVAGASKFPPTFSKFLKDLGERGSLWRVEAKAPNAIDWEGIFRKSYAELGGVEPEVARLFDRWSNIPGPHNLKLELFSDMKANPGKYKFLFTDEGIKGESGKYVNPEKIENIKGAIEKYPDQYRILEFPDELAEVAKYKDPYQIIVDEKELYKYLQYIDPETIAKYMKSEGKGLGTGILDIAKAKLKDESGKVDVSALAKTLNLGSAKAKPTGPIRTMSSIEGHHPIPLPNKAKLPLTDEQMKAIDWHLENYMDAGWKSVKEMPKGEHIKLHKSLLETAKEKLTGKEGQRGSISNKYIDQEEGVADPIFDRAKEHFDRTWSDFADSPLHGVEVDFGELGHHYLTGKIKEHGGRKYLQAFKPWTEEEIVKRKAMFTELNKKRSAKGPQIQMDPGDLGNYTYLPEDQLINTGRRVVEQETKPLFKEGDKVQFLEGYEDWRTGIPPKAVGEVVDDIGGSIGDTISIKWPGGKITHEWPHRLQGLLDVAKKKLTGEEGYLSNRKVDELIYKITGVKPAPETGLPRKIPSNKLQPWLDKGWIKGSESTTSEGTKLTTIYPPEAKPTKNYMTKEDLLDIAKKKLTGEEGQRGSLSNKSLSELIDPDLTLKNKEIKERIGKMVPDTTEVAIEFPWEMEGGKFVEKVYVPSNMMKDAIDALNDVKKYWKTSSNIWREWGVALEDRGIPVKVVFDPTSKQHMKDSFKKMIDNIRGGKIEEALGLKTDIKEGAIDIAPSVEPKLLDIAKKKLTGEEGQRGSISRKKVKTNPVKEVEDDTLPPEWRAELFKDLSFTPEREKLLNPETLSSLEDFLGVYKELFPKGKAHGFGSVFSGKSNPNDLDILLEAPSIKSFLNLNKALISFKGQLKDKPSLSGLSRIQFTPSPPLEEVPNNIRRIRKVGQDRGYGPNYDLVRILSAMGLLAPLSQMIERNE